MLDLSNQPAIITFVDREDKAMLRSNLSARSMPGDGRGHGYYLMLLSPYPSLGFKAKNLLAWGEATSKAKITKYGPPVGHMSTSSIRMVLFQKIVINGLIIGSQQLIMLAEL